MTKPTFDEDVLRARLAPLSRTQRLAFALSCCERLLPNYVVFHSAEEWGSPDALRRVLMQCWDIAAGANLDDQDLSELAAGLEEVIPNSEDFGSTLGSAAMDAGGALERVLNFLDDGEMQALVDVASLSVDTVEMYLQERLDEEGATPTEQDIWSHDLMQIELSLQRQDLEEVESWSTSVHAVEHLRRRSEERGQLLSWSASS